MVWQHDSNEKSFTLKLNTKVLASSNGIKPRHFRCYCFVPKWPSPGHLYLRQRHASYPACPSSRHPGSGRGHGGQSLGSAPGDSRPSGCSGHPCSCVCLASRLSCVIFTCITFTLTLANVFFQSLQPIKPLPKSKTCIKCLAPRHQSTNHFVNTVQYSKLKH